MYSENFRGGKGLHVKVWEHPPQVASALEPQTFTPVHAHDAGSGAATDLAPDRFSAGDSSTLGGLVAFDAYSDSFLNDGGLSNEVGSAHVVGGLISSRTRRRRAALATTAPGNQSRQEVRTLYLVAL